MKAKSMNLVWIIVKDLKQAIKFYTEVVGLKLVEFHEEYHWAELEGHDGGARLGIGQQCKEDDLKVGKNAIATFTVEDIVKARKELEEKGAKCIGPIEEVPGHVKMQLIVDNDGHHLQLVQTLH